MVILGRPVHWLTLPDIVLLLAEECVLEFFGSVMHEGPCGLSVRERRYLRGDDVRCIHVVLPSELLQSLSLLVTAPLLVTSPKLGSRVSDLLKLLT